MVKKYVYECDRCSQNCGDIPVRVCLVVGHDMDPSGNGHVDVRHNADLCVHCSAALISRLTSTDYGVASSARDWITKGAR